LQTGTLRKKKGERRPLTELRAAFTGEGKKKGVPHLIKERNVGSTQKNTPDTPRPKKRGSLAHYHREKVGGESNRGKLPWGQKNRSRLDTVLTTGRRGNRWRGKKKLGGGKVS